VASLRTAVGRRGQSIKFMNRRTARSDIEKPRPSQGKVIVHFLYYHTDLLVHLWRARAKFSPKCKGHMVRTKAKLSNRDSENAPPPAHFGLWLGTVWCSQHEDDLSYAGVTPKPLDWLWIHSRGAGSWIWPEKRSSHTGMDVQISVEMARNAGGCRIKQTSCDSPPALPRL